MFDDVNDIAIFYNNCLEKEHTRLERHQLEYDLTWCYLNKYLPSQGKILEIGAATGRYTLELARRGYQITAVDLSQTLLDKNRTVLLAEGLEDQVQFFVADARDLNQVPGSEFDAVLLMGPLYHLVFESDRTQALQGAYERLDKGGRIFSAFISRYGIFGDLMKNVPEWIEDSAEVSSILEKGRDPDHNEGGFRGYFARISEIGPLHEAVGFESLALAGVEPGISAEDEVYNRLEGEQRRLWLEFLFEVSREPSTLGASRHLLYIGQK